MLKYLCPLVSFLFLFPPTPVLADAKLSDILRGVQDRYGHLPGLSVAYKREIRSRSMILLGDEMGADLATGKIHFKPPHFLRVQQETPTPEAVITDGRTLWWYIPQKKQAYIYPARKLGEELKLLSDIFQGLKEMGERFDVILTGYDMKGKHQLQLTPNPPWPEINYIRLSVAQESYHIQVLEIHNHLGGFTRFILGNPTVQKSFEDGFFQFVVPEGVKVIEEE
jgi:outer membrane lipoprotein carrier protein